MAAVVDESITIYREINQDYKESVSLLGVSEGEDTHRETNQYRGFRSKEEKEKTRASLRCAAVIAKCSPRLYQKVSRCA